jgi:phage terminase large subunit-like protein
MERRYRGTRLGEQEIEGRLLEAVEGALWDADMIDASRVWSAPPMRRRVLVLDPSGSETGKGDECGIVLAGHGEDDHFYALGDYSARLDPTGWGSRAIEVAKAQGIETIHVETNYGGAQGPTILRLLGWNGGIQPISASEAKSKRAGYINGLWQQGRAHIVGTMPELEAQLCAMTESEYKGEGSPDRLDAYVHAIRELEGGGGPTLTTATVTRTRTRHRER